MRGGGAGRLLRAALIAVAIVALTLGGLTLTGGFLPDAPIVGGLGALLNDGLGWIWISVGGAALASLLAVLLGGRRAPVLLVAMSFAGCVAAGIVTYCYSSFADANGATFSLARQLQAAGRAPAVDEILVYATVGTQGLHAGLWLPPQGSAPSTDPRPRPVILYLHGGAFVAGGLGMRPQLLRAWADAGIVVVDVEYRLSPPPRWADAPGDALCALGWLPTIADAHAIDLARVVVVGESAGGSLALVSTYAAGPVAAGSDVLGSSCGGAPVQPAGVVAVAPAADLAGIWEDATIGDPSGRFPESYVGGPPDAHPDRYAAASPARLIRPGLPPTLLLAAERDHLVRLPRVVAIADALRAVGTPVRLLVLPFTDHGFDAPPNGFGAQVEEQLVLQFIEQLG